MRAARRDDFNRNVDRQRRMRRQVDLPLRFPGTRRLINAQLDLRLARDVGRVVHDRAQDQFVAHIRECWNARLDHDRFVDLEGRLRRAQLALPCRRDSNDAIARETVGRDELRSRAALRVRPQRGVPKRAGEEVLAQAIEQRRSTFAIADEIALVRKIRFLRGLHATVLAASGSSKHRGRAVD